MAKQTKLLQIFRAGRHTAMSGATLAFSDVDLEATAAAYDPAKSEAPIVVGHPTTDGPAYGWVRSLSFADGRLEAEPHQVDPAFAELVEAGRFKKISASFFTPGAANNPVPGVYYLRHVGFLGAQPPAVKGLRSPSFDGADTDEGILSFTGAFADPSPPQEILMTPEAMAALEAENATLRQQLKDAADAAIAVRRAASRATHQAFAEALIGAGRLLPAQQPLTVALLDHLADPDLPASFADGEEERPLLDGVKALLAALPVQLSFAEHATRDRQAAADLNDPVALAHAAQVFQESEQAAGRSVSIAQAVASVSRPASR